ncbi:MAG: hypothetical protein NC926_08940 [Candidatus Omnitrophica bacterium]|nr:hypothetical protein [Candidatus Omnitrophota bacterium]
MPGILLQNMLEDTRLKDLPVRWNTFDLENFSKTKKLEDFPKKQLKIL